MIRRIICMDKH